MFPEAFALEDKRVHIWRATRDVSPVRLKDLEALLSSDEKNRAYRFHFSEDKNRFIAHRALLRLLLSRYLGVEPLELRFSYNPQGKPLLENTSRAPICFNLSHSQELALYAFTMGREVGVDIEALRLVPDAEKIAERYFTGEEAQRLREAPSHLKNEIFLQLWTAKEAFIKALGMGLSMPLNQFEAAHVPGWSLYPFVPAPGFTAALAVKEDEYHFDFFDGDRLVEIK